MSIEPISDEELAGLRAYCDKHNGGALPSYVPGLLARLSAAERQVAYLHGSQAQLLDDAQKAEARAAEAEMALSHMSGQRDAARFLADRYRSALRDWMAAWDEFAERNNIPADEAPSYVKNARAALDGETGE